MSRNIKIKMANKASKPPSKQRRREISSSDELTDSDGYSDLDSNEDDEEDVEAAEEQHLIDRALHRVRASSPRPSVDSDTGSDSDDEEEEEDTEDLTSTADDADDEDCGNDQDEDLPQTWADPFSIKTFFASELDSQPPKTPTMGERERHVRFADQHLPTSDTDTATESDVGDMFPDIMSRPANGAPFGLPNFQNQPSNGEQERFDSGVSAELRLLGKIASAFPTWDDQDPNGIFGPYFAGPSDRVVNTPPIKHQQVSEDYDSETTETDDEAPLLLEKSKTAQAASTPQGDITSLDDLSDPETPVIGHLTKHSGKPRSGKVKIRSNSSRAVVVYDRSKGRLMTITRQTVEAMDKMEDPNPFFELPAGSNVDFLNPYDFEMLFQHGDVMMGMDVPSQLSTPASSFGQTGSAETFFPLLSPGTLNQSSDEAELLQDIDEGEEGLNLDDFISYDILNVTEAELNGDFSQLPATPSQDPTTPTTPRSLSFPPTTPTPTEILFETPEPPMAPPTTPASQGFPQPSPIIGRKRPTEPESDQAHKKQRSISEVGNIQI